MQEPLGSCCGTLSAQSGHTDAYHSYVQPSIPREHRSKPPRDAPGTRALFLTFCWPPQQRLLDRVDLDAHGETILLAQPFPQSQFMPGINISLGNSLTAANICIELEEREHGEDWGNAAWPVPAELKLYLVPQPGPQPLSSRPGLTRPPAATAEARSTITNNSFS